MSPDYPINNNKKNEALGKSLFMEGIMFTEKETPSVRQTDKNIIQSSKTQFVKNLIQHSSG